MKKIKGEEIDLEDILKGGYMKILKGIAIAFVLTILLLFIYSMLLTYTKMGESTMAPAIILITAVSILAGSSIRSKFY